MGPEAAAALTLLAGLPNATSDGEASDILFTYYRSPAVRANMASPSQGGALGSTLVAVHGEGFQDFGGMRCRFGFPGQLPIVNATLIDYHTVRCRTPIYAEYLASTGNGSLPSLPATLPVSVILNGQDEGGVETAIDGTATFTFGAEPCSGVQTLTALNAVVDDGLSGKSAEYGGTSRNCTWQLAPVLPSTVNASDGYALYITLRAVDLRDGVDTLTIVNGLVSLAGVAGEHVLLSLPAVASSPASSSSQVPPDGGTCGAAVGACAQTVMVPSTAATVHLLSQPRADGTTSRLYLTYSLLAPPIGDSAGSLRPSVTQSPSDSSEPASQFVPLSIRRAREWRNPAERTPSTTLEPDMATTAPWQWANEGNLQSVPPLSTSFE